MTNPRDVPCSGILLVTTEPTCGEACECTDVLSQQLLLDRKLGRRARSWGCLLRAEGVSEAGQGLALREHRKARVGDTHCLCRGRGPLREERILEHKSNEV